MVSHITFCSLHYGGCASDYVRNKVEVGLGEKASLFWFRSHLWAFAQNTLICIILCAYLLSLLMPQLLKHFFKISTILKGCLKMTRMTCHQCRNSLFTVPDRYLPRIFSIHSAALCPKGAYSKEFEIFPNIQINLVFFPPWFFVSSSVSSGGMALIFAPLFVLTDQIPLISQYPSFSPISALTTCPMLVLLFP